MDKDQIIQLRNHHLKQGRNNDRRPIYPITKAECIIGDVGGGVEKVDTLPEKGEEGKIYYNNADGIYYVYDKKGFTAIGSDIEKVISLPFEGEEGKIYYHTIRKQYYTYDTEKGFTNLSIPTMLYGKTPRNNSVHPEQYEAYNLEPNKYYDFDTFYTINIYTTPLPVRIYFEDINNQNVINSYVFRMTIPSTGGVNITLNNLTIPNSAKEILDNLVPTHRYEFNVFGKVLLVTDITATSN